MKRRRLIVALFVVACLSAFAAWRMSWRGDPRFVGRWVFVRNDAQPPSMMIEFHANGSGALYNPWSAGRTTEPATRFTWRVEGQRFVIEHQPWETGYKRLLVMLQNGYQRLIGEPTRQRMIEYQINQLAPDHWRFSGGSESGTEEWEIARESAVLK